MLDANLKIHITCIRIHTQYLISMYPGVNLTRVNWQNVFEKTSYRCLEKAVWPCFGNIVVGKQLFTGIYYARMPCMCFVRMKSPVVQCRLFGYMLPVLLVGHHVCSHLNFRIALDFRHIFSKHVSVFEMYLLNATCSSLLCVLFFAFLSIWICMNMYI